LIECLLALAPVTIFCTARCDRSRFWANLGQRSRQHQHTLQGIGELNNSQQLNSVSQFFETERDRAGSCKLNRGATYRNIESCDGYTGKHTLKHIDGVTLAKKECYLKNILEVIPEYTFLCKVES
jgi:hypothetical protein